MSATMQPATMQPATMKGPAIFLAQFIGDTAPFDSFDAICGWAAGLGYRGVQVPTTDPGMIETAFDELASRWRPILDAYDEAGVDLCFEIHPGEDVCDGITFEMFLA